MSGRVSRSLALLCILLFVVSASAQLRRDRESARQPPRDPVSRVDKPVSTDQPAAPDDLILPHGANSPGFAKSEKGCRGARVLDYLERHGDWGYIDPDGLLERTRQMHWRLREDRERLRGFAIGGTVWTSMGPTNGAGRATAVANHPATSSTALIGAAGGGVWKTTNNGVSWIPLTDTLANLSVGALAYAPSSASTVYLGTGEGGLGGDFIPGIGLLASSDGGDNWTLPSSVLAPMFYRISVHPSNAQQLVIGTNLGALRSTGGQNGPWTTVIASASGPAVTGYGHVTDIVRDPTNALVMYAATWDGLYWCARYGCSDPENYNSPTVLKSSDGGQTWSAAATGLPVSTFDLMVNRISIAIAPSNTQVLYAALSTTDGNTGVETSRIYKTTNGGGSWAETNLSASANPNIRFYLGAQAWYDNTIVVAPSDPNTVIAGGVHYVKSADGGTSWTAPTFTGTGVHVDAHDLRYDGAGTLWIANDGGIWTTTDHGNTATERNSGLVTRQFYDLTNDPVNRMRVFGGQQDNGTIRRGDGGGTSWDFFTGGDGFQSAVLGMASSITFSTFQNAAVNRSMDGGAATVVTSNVSPGYPSAEARPFFSLLGSHPSDPSTIFSVSYRLWKSTTGGDAWTPLPVTTTDATTWSTSSGVRGMAISRSNPQIMMVSKGNTVFRTTNGGTTWTNVQNGIPGKFLTSLEIDPADPNKAYASFAGTSGTSVYYTLNGGTSWTPRGTGLPEFSAQVVRVDPTDSNALYCGTDVGVYRSTDGGANWARFGTGMPAVSVYDIDILHDGTVLRAATHGRGMWELTVTGSTNVAPSVAISTPATPTLTVAKGASSSFAGTFTDGNGDTMTARWLFPDTWATTSVASGGTVSHVFPRGGKYPVTLSATDTNGAIGAGSVLVTVTESGDACATPIVIPAAGPFPYTIAVETAGATAQGSDPTSAGACYLFAPQKSIWLSFTPASTGTYQFSLCGSKGSAILVGYTGNACGPYTNNAAICLARTSPGADCATETVATATLTAGVTTRLLLTNYFYNEVSRLSLTVTQGSVFTPVISGISPVAGTAAGGTPVVVNGSGFVGGSTSISIGGVAATSVSVIDSFTLTAVTGAHAVGTVDVTATNGGSPSTLAGGFTYVAANLAAPTGVVATASSTSNVNIVWNSVAGAVMYEVYRRAAGGGFTLAGSTAATNLADGGRTANTAYLYVVRAIGAAAETSPDSAADLATTTIYTNDPAVAGTTSVAAAHITQLRTAVDAVRALAGLGGGSYPQTVNAGVVITALHMTELRAALTLARSTLGLGAITYTFTPASGALIRAADINELRGGTK